MTPTPHHGTMSETKKLGDPANIPPRFSRGWWKRCGTALKLACIDFMVDNGPHWAAAIAFYTLLSLFPLVLGIIAVAGLIVDAEWAASQVATVFADFVPDGEGDLEAIVASGLQAGGAAGFIPILFLLWSGTWVFGALTTAMNMAYDIDNDYPFWRQLLFRLAMLLSVGVFMVIAVLSDPAIQILMRELPGDPNFIQSALSVSVPIALMIAAFFLIYWLVPRCSVAWVPALVGAVLATGAFLISREAFVAYLAQWGSEFDVIYGSLAVGIILVFWAWIVGIILLLGAEITSHLQALMVHGLTPEEVWQHHIKRSPDRKSRES